MVRQDRAQISSCSIFDTIRLLGEKSSLNDQIITILHKDDDNVYGLPLEPEYSETPLIINAAFDPNITHFESVSIIADTEMLVEEIVKEKDETSIVYLDETVYSALFDYISSHSHHSSMPLEKREHITRTLFHMIKSNQNYDEHIPEEDIQPCHKTHIHWSQGTIPSTPKLVQEHMRTGVLSRPFLMPILSSNDATKDKITELSIETFIERTRNTLQHVCSLPKTTSAIEYIREYIDDIHQQLRTEYIKGESSKYILSSNPFECEFKYKNLYRSNHRTVCSSDGGSDRLYYTDLSRRNSTSPSPGDVEENEFTRVLHYPTVRKYTDLTKTFPISGYHTRPATIADAKFNLRHLSPYIRGNIETQNLIHSHRSEYPLIQYVDAIKYTNQYPTPDISASSIGERVNDVAEALDISKIIQHHETELQMISNISQYSQLLSRYSLSVDDTSSNIRSKIYNQITSCTKKLHHTTKQLNSQNKIHIDAVVAYKELFHNTLQRFMNLIQMKSEYVTINQELSQTCAKIRDIQKKYTLSRNIPNQIMGMKTNVEIQTHHLYAWIYTLCVSSFEYSAFLDHVYDDPLLDTERTTSIIDTLIRTVVNIYQFSEIQSITPKDLQHTNISVCDIQNIKKTHAILTSEDSGKLFSNLLNNKYRFAYIVTIKEDLLDFGRRRYEHLMAQNEESTPWKDMSETEQLQYTPNQKYSKHVFNEIIQPLINSFRSSPRGLCSSHNVVKIYDSVEEMKEDVQEPMTNSHTTFSNKIMQTLKSMLEGRQGESAQINDELFDRLYYSITQPEQMKARTQRPIRDGEYVSLRNTNILYQRVGQSWQREEIDIQSEMNQCPFNFAVIEELGWENLTQHATELSKKSLESMCVYEERLQECLPYPLHKMYQFLLKLFARYYEIATNIHTIEKQYTEIVATMKRVIAENPPPPKQVLQKPNYVEKLKDTQGTQLQSILKIITTSELFDEDQVRGCHQLLTFIKSHIDRSRMDDDKYIHWNFTHPKLCRHWSSFATAVLQNPDISNTAAHEVRMNILHTFFKQWPYDKHKYCLCCGSSVAQFTDGMEGNEWEQISDGKEAVRTIRTGIREKEPHDPTTAILAAEIAEDKVMNDHIRTFLKMFAKTMGMNVPDDHFSVLCTNVIIPRIRIQAYREFVADVVSTDPKLEKRKTAIEKDRLKYAERADAEPNFFHRQDKALLQFFHRQIHQEKPKKQKKLAKHIQTLEWLETYYQNYVEEQQLIAILSTLYVHVGVHIPDFTINKKDSMSDVKIIVNVFTDLESRKYTFIQTLTVFLYRLLTTPSELAWPSIQTRKRMIHKIRTNRGDTLTNEGAAYALYRPRMIAYIEQLREIYPNFEQLRQEKASEVQAKAKNESKTLASYRPIYDRSRSAEIERSPVEQLMDKIEQKLNTATIVPYATSSCVFPYAHDDTMSYPYIQSLFGTAPTLPVMKDHSLKNTHTLFVPTPPVVQIHKSKSGSSHSQTSSDYTFLQKHSAHYIESRYKTLFQKYSPSGELLAYKPLHVSAALLQSDEYANFKNDEELSSAYHPAIVEGVEQKTNIIYRNVTKRDGAQFKSNHSMAIDKSEFQQRVMARRKTQIIPEVSDMNQEEPLSFQVQFHHVCSSLWEDNEFIRVLVEESKEGTSFFSRTDSKHPDKKSKNETKQTKQKKQTRAQHIHRILRMIEEECNHTHGLSELMTLVEDGSSDIHSMHQIIACIQCFLSSRINNVWSPIMKKYSPVSGKEATEILENALLQLRNVHTMPKQVMLPLTQHYQNRVQAFPKTLAADRLSIKSVRYAINSMNMTQFDEEEMKYTHLLFVYIVVKQIALLDSLSVSTIQKEALKQACLQIVRDIISIRKVSEEDMDEMQQYIDQKNNASRVRSIEKLKRIDPALENSHHMFRRNNLGNLSEVGSHFDFNDDEINEEIQDEDSVLITEEGYSTLLEEDGEML